MALRLSSRLARMFDHDTDAADLAADFAADVEHADDDDDHLQKVGDRHRPHAAEQGIDEDGARTNPHAGELADLAARDHVEDQSQCRNLRSDPAQIGHDDGERGQCFRRTAETPAVEIAYGQQVHAIQRGSEEYADQDQAKCGTERVGHHAVQAFLQEYRGDAEHGLGAEPSGKYGGGDDMEGQVPAGNGEILGAVHASRRPEADGDGDNPVSDDEPEQHGDSP